MYPTSCDILQGYADGTSLNTKANTVESLETIYTKRLDVLFAILLVVPMVHVVAARQELC